MRALFLALAIIFGLGAPALAVQPDEVLADARLEARARSLSHQLRCMVCQNQSIDDSDAPLARDLRLLVRERLTLGDTDRQVVDFLVSRYGEFVLLKPRFEWRTALLWVVPPGVVLMGAGAIVMLLRKRTEVVLEPAELTAAEQARLTALERD